MFYSRTLLARKTPLGTVWMAAHLQHKLRKSDVAVIDISKSVDCIMYPEVPIALRLTGFLLLGVVRIYSKKVDYLYHDCNMLVTQIRTAFATIQVNLPEDASHAPFHAVTLPETYELDALDVDDAVHLSGSPDNHLKTHEEITMAGSDQVPTDGDPYIAVYIDEESEADTSHSTGLPNDRAAPMEEDVVRPLFQEGAVGLTDPGPSNRAERSNEKQHEDHLPEGLPEEEVMREAEHPSGYGNPLEWPDPTNDIVEQDQHFDGVMNDKDNPSLNVKGFSGFQEESIPSPFHPTSESPGFVEKPGLSDIPSGPPLCEEMLQPTPTPNKEETKPKSRKRKQLFDKSLVLTNAFMKKQLEDTSKLLRKRRKLPCSALDSWRCQKSSQLEQILFVPSITGVGNNLQEVMKQGFLAPKVDSSPNRVLPESRDAQSPAQALAYDMEIEHARFGEQHFDTVLPESIPSPSGREQFTPISRTFESASQTGKFQEIEVLHTPEMTASTEPVGVEPEWSMGANSLSDIPEMQESPQTEELSFLEADNTPTGQEENEVDMLSVRTRAVAEFLKKKSPETQISKALPGNLSLNGILEGKTRKHCARMFFETLVLKSYGLIDIQQEEAHGDITLTLTPALSKAKL